MGRGAPPRQSTPPHLHPSTPPPSPTQNDGSKNEASKAPAGDLRGNAGGMNDGTMRREEALGYGGVLGCGGCCGVEGLCGVEGRWGVEGCWGVEGR